MFHAYLSAVAFIALMFFSATGLLLNHPTWLARSAAQETSRSFTLPAPEIAAAMRQGDRTRGLAAAAARHQRLLGVYRSGSVEGDEALIRLSGPRGATDLDIDLKNGVVQASTRPANLVSLLNDLHKGKDAGAVWRLIIDVWAALFLALSIIGYALFFSLRFRLRTSLILTGASLVLVFAAFWLSVA